MATLLLDTYKTSSKLYILKINLCYNTIHRLEIIMNINKLKEANNLHYSKKELQLLYWQAQARDIKKKELKDIKKSLYEIIDLGQPSSIFINLLKTLKCLPNNALKRIENGEFKKFYTILKNKEHNENGPFYKGDFHHCIKLLTLLYTNYFDINSKQEFELVSNSFNELIYINDSEELNNMIFNINPHLSYIIEDYKRYQELTSTINYKNYNNIVNDLDKLHKNLQVALLINIELFNYQYQLPTDIILFLYDNFESANKNLLKSYNESEDKYQFAKTLLTEYLNLLNNKNNLHSNKKYKKII